MLADGQAQLKTTKEELDAALEKLVEGEKQLASGKAQLSKGRSALKKGRKKLDEGRQQLIDGWDTLEDAAEAIRSKLRSGLGSAGDSISWASRRSVDIDDPKADATKLYITSSIKFDLGSSLKSNVRSVVNSIEDEALIALYEKLTGGDE